MAETKTKSSGARTAPKSKHASRQDTTGRSRQKATATGRSSQVRSSNGRRTSATTQRRRSNAARGSRAGQSQSQTVIAKAADKAKVPAIAAGAALAGVAGGVVLGRNGKSRGMNLPGLRSRESMVKLLGTGAKEIGKAGYKIGQLTSEVRKVREAVSVSAKD
jgi:hypothetical protein